MKNKRIFGAKGFIGLLCFISVELVHAGTLGLLTYSVSGGSVTITDCDSAATNVVVPATIESKAVTAIGDYAFSDCILLTDVQLPGSVDSLGYRAFHDCLSLTEITIPAGVASIGDATFSDCRSLSNMVLPNSVTNIGESAFRDCVSLTNIMISSSVASIGNSAFSSCDLLQEVSLPNSVTSLGRSAFYSCDVLTSVGLSENITSIEDSTFYNCQSLTDITIPAGVTNIGRNAFMICRGLRTARFMGDAPTTLGSSAFYATSKEFVIFHPPGSSGYSAPEWDRYAVCPWLFSYEIIGDSAVITNCETMASGRVYIPEVIEGMSVMAIAENAFSGCSSMTELILASGVTQIGADAFSGCNSLMGIKVPLGVETVGDRAFQGCSSLLEANFMGVSPTSFGSDVFTGTDAGFTIHYQGDSAGFSTPSWQGYPAFPWYLDYRIEGGVVEIDDCNTNAIGTVVIPPAIEGFPVTIIDNHAFNSCSQMTGVTLPTSVTNIGYSTFIYCSSLTSITIPVGVASIGEGAFFDCASLQAINVEAGSLFYASQNGVLFNSEQSEIIFYPGGKAGAYFIPASVTSIGDSAFAGCDLLSGITIPYGVTNIGEAAFTDCDLLTEVVVPAGVETIEPHTFSNCDALSNISLPDGLRTIRYYAFGYCPALSTLVVPSSVTNLVYSISEHCEGLQNIHVEAGNAVYSSLDGVLLSADGTELIKFPEGRAGTYTLPESVGEFGNSSFSHCERLEGLVLHAGFTNLPWSGFFRCESLVSMTVDDANPEYSDIGGAIFSKDGTVLVRCPPGRSGTYALPSGTEEIDDWAFYYCKSLISVQIPASITSVSSVGFSGCDALSSVLFMGDAPDYFSTSTFQYAADGFTIYYKVGGLGFTSPTWKGYPSVEINGVISEAGLWMLGLGLPYDAGLDQDLNGDGVTLLAAYALNLDPTLDLSGSLPQPVIAEDTLNMTYYAASPGVTYTVETSEDLEAWTTAGVSVSGLDPDNKRTASIGIESPSRFLRLKVEK